MGEAMTARKKTSPRISSLASKYIRMSDEEFRRDDWCRDEQFFAEVRSMAASLLSQDEVPTEPTYPGQGTGEAYDRNKP